MIEALLIGAFILIGSLALMLLLGVLRYAIHWTVNYALTTIMIIHRNILKQTVIKITGITTLWIICKSTKNGRTILKKR